MVAGLRPPLAQDSRHLPLPHFDACTRSWSFRGIVQDWYLEMGRRLEKQAFGCAVAASVVLVRLILAVLAMSVGERF